VPPIAESRIRRGPRIGTAFPSTKIYLIPLRVLCASVVNPSLFVTSCTSSEPSSSWCLTLTHSNLENDMSRKKIKSGLRRQRLVNSILPGRCITFSADQKALKNEILLCCLTPTTIYLAGISEAGRGIV